MLNTDLFAAVGREITAQEPLVTWNLFLTAFIVPASAALASTVLGIFISYKLRKRDEKDAQIAMLRDKLAEEKEKSVVEWRQNHQAILCGVKSTLDAIEKSLENKIDKEDCIRERSDVWDAVNKLREKNT